MTEFSYPYVSAESSGEYFQVLFAESGDSEGAYFLIQGESESCDGDLFYIERHDARLCGHFKVRWAELGRDIFRLEVACEPAETVQVRFQADDTLYRRLKCNLRIMMPVPILTIEGERNGPAGVKR